MSTDLSACDLQGEGILVTRPVHQAQELCDLIEARGGRPVPFPALEILPPRDREQASDILRQARGWVIFVSPNAVNYGLALLEEAAFPLGVKLGTVGKSTAKALRTAGHAVDLLPRERFDSEGLLALPELTRITGQQVVIVRGEGGRPLLGDTLTARGAEVVYAEVYRRHCPEIVPAPLLRRWEREVALVTATSKDILVNLISILGPEGWTLLRQTPLLVISERMKREAEQIGFGTILVARKADSLSIVERLCEWAEQQSARDERH